MKTRILPDRFAAAAGASAIVLISGIALTAADPDRILPPATSAPAAATLPFTQGPSELGLESHYFVVDDRDLNLLPEPVRRRLSAFDGRNADRTDQTLSGDELESFLTVMRHASSALPDFPILKMKDNDPLHALVENQQAYVSSLTEVLAPGAGLFDPQVSDIASRGIDVKCSVSRQSDANNYKISITASLTRLLALVPVTRSMKIQSIKVPGTFQVVSGTYQLPVSGKYQLRSTNVPIPDGQAILLGDFRQTIENGITAATQPSLTQANRDFLRSEKHQRVFVVLQPRLIAIGVAPQRGHTKALVG